MSVFNSGQPIIIPNPVVAGGVQTVTAGSYVTVTGTAANPIISSEGNPCTYNEGGGFTGSPFAVANLANQDFVTLTAIAHSTSYPENGAAYLLTFNWSVRSASFNAAPSGNLTVVVINGPTVTSGAVIGQSCCFVNADIPAPPTAGPIATGSCSAVFHNDNDVDISIGLGNFSGEEILEADIQIFSISMTKLTANPTVLNNFV
jgi:hypothetical protein